MNAAAQPWADSAHRSLDAADVLHHAHLWPQTCFNAQQSVEIMFKAAIASTNVAPPRVHGVMDLFALLDAALQHLAGDLRTLDLYYMPTRYPDTQPGMLPGGLPGQAEATAALDTAREVVRTVEPMLP